MEIDLPVRNRVVDGGYLIEGEAGRQVIHVEFFRRHQDLSEVSFEVGGAEEEAVRQAAAAIEQRVDLPSGQRADHLAVLRFLAEAEKVPVAVLQLFLTREKMMESTLYREIFQEGKAEGKAEGEAKGKAELLIRLLAARLGRVAPDVRQAIVAQAQADPELLNVWFDEVAVADTDEATQRVIRKITAV